MQRGHASICLPVLPRHLLDQRNAQMDSAASSIQENGEAESMGGNGSRAANLAEIQGLLCQHHVPPFELIAQELRMRVNERGLTSDRQDVHSFVQMLRDHLEHAQCVFA